MITTTIDPLPHKFKDTLFESVSFQPWSLEYKMVFTETRLMLDEVLTELHRWYAATHTLFEADTLAAEEVLDKFRNLGSLSPDHFEKLKAHVSTPKGDSPPGMLNKILNGVKKSIERLSKLYTFPDVEAKIQEAIQKAMDKAQDKGFGKLLNPVLRTLKTLADTMKGTWVPSLVLVVLGIAVSLLSLPAIIGGGLWVFSIIMILARIVADLVKGKTLAYSFTKAVALWGAGYGAAELFKTVMPLLQAALTSTPPTTIGALAGAAADTSAALGNVPQPDLPPDALPRGGVPAASLVSTGNPYIDGLQRLYGEPVKQFSGNFNQAFAAARRELGAGKLFSWMNPSTGNLTPYTTNLAIPGAKPGALNLAGLSTNVVNYLRGK